MCGFSKLQGAWESSLIVGQGRFETSKWFLLPLLRLYQVVPCCTRIHPESTGHEINENRKPFAAPLAAQRSRAQRAVCGDWPHWPVWEPYTEKDTDNFIPFGWKHQKSGKMLTLKKWLTLLDLNGFDRFCHQFLICCLLNFRYGEMLAEVRAHSHLDALRCAWVLKGC